MLQCTNLLRLHDTSDIITFILQHLIQQTTDRRICGYYTVVAMIALCHGMDVSSHACNENVSVNELDSNVEREVVAVVDSLPTNADRERKKVECTRRGGYVILNLVTGSWCSVKSAQTVFTRDACSSALPRSHHSESGLVQAVLFAGGENELLLIVCKWFCGCVQCRRLCHQVNIMICIWFSFTYLSYACISHSL